MTVFHYPGNLRIGLRNEDAAGVSGSAMQIGEDRQMLFLLISGHQRFLVNDAEFVLSTLIPGQTGPQALLLRVAAGSRVEYLESQGRPLVKIGIITDPDWLDHAGEVDESEGPDIRPPARLPGLPRDVTHRAWTPGADMLAIAQDMVAVHRQGVLGAIPREAMSLSLMSRGVDLYLTALQAAVPPLRDGQPGHPRIAALAGYIASHLDDPDLGPEDLARACGLGLRSLQRLCRRTMDCSPSEFIRAQRLEAAFAALRRGSVNVAQAAFMAGYSSAANFSTAFKREFGVTPGRAQELR
ncbi:helix-turn-helix transcriptional regulator [Pseudogemmobacter humi]|uniref:HTH-type transcriptional activator RhaS n=1 Tax=Pseudogemmobacter humi TaxID=2483812 RepID=A0A3P5XFC9_9RHOB|nr:AraC family transcriptional regulator [Pseudogemmobacter humi]VDC33465.1 HTH-type transcriptional activator RhaS [Pseudogemmobacter humi]